ncbi:MAG: SPASM domain-containing protein [Pseudodesulfovibrio sp.]|nr:SPASM domain-containing protein [Pseudodesulfovibrio sp.]
MKNLKSTLIQDPRYRKGLEKRLERPQILIALTNYCNLSCVYCSTGKVRNKPVNMDIELVKTLVDQCVDNKWPFSFGQTYEPFLHPQIDQIVQYVTDRDVRFFSATNGTVMKPAVYDHPMDLLMSYSSTHEDYAYRGSKIKFDTYTSKILEFLEHRINKLIPGKIILQIADYSLLEGKLEYNKEIYDIDGIYAKSLDLASRLGLAPPENEQEARDIIAKRQDLVLFEGKDTSIIVKSTKILSNSYDAFVEIPDSLPPKGYCDSCYTMLSIQADGQVAFCCCDPSAQAVAGKIDTDTNLKDFWLGKEMTHIRDCFHAFKPAHDFCTKCLFNVSENIKPLLTVKNSPLVAEILHDQGVANDLPWFQFPSAKK